MRAPHLRAAFAIAVRWEGVVLALVPVQVLLLHLWLFGKLPFLRAIIGLEDTLLGLHPAEWGYVLHSLLAGAAAVLLLPLVRDYRGLRFALLRRRRLVVLAAAAIPYLVPKVLRASGLDPLDLPGFAVHVACVTIAPAWVAGALLQGEFGARRTASAAAVMGSAAVVALGMGLLTWGLAEPLMEALFDLIGILPLKPVPWAIVVAGHIWAWLAFTAQAWFLRRMFAPTLKPAANP